MFPSFLLCDNDRVLLLIIPILDILFSRRVVLRTGAISTWPPSRLDLRQNTMPTTYGLWYRYDARFFSSSIYVRVEPLDESGKMKRQRRE